MYKRQIAVLVHSKYDDKEKLEKFCAENRVNLIYNDKIDVYKRQVGGSAMKRFGFLDKIVNNLKEAGMEVEVFEGIEPDPSVTTVMRGCLLYTSRCV